MQPVHLVEDLVDGCTIALDILCGQYIMFLCASLLMFTRKYQISVSLLYTDS